MTRSWAAPAGAVFGVFAKKPEPGRVKTRVAARYGPAAAAELHEAMLLDLVANWAGADVLGPGIRRVLAYAPADAGAWFDARLPTSFAREPQRDGDLGCRMQAFFDGEFARGASRVVLIGADAPTLDPTVVVDAFRHLDHRDVALGPAADGGYYLIGSRLRPPPVFDAVDWGSPNVLTQTVERLRASGRSLAVLPPWYDVDTPDDVTALAGHIAAMRYAGVDPRLPRTEVIIRRLTQGEPP